MSDRANELAELLVEHYHGPVESCVFRFLLLNGRQTFSSIIHHSGLTETQVKTALTTLILHKLVIWNGVIQEYYRADWSVAYNLIRIPKFVELVRSRFSRHTAEVLLRCIYGDVNTVSNNETAVRLLDVEAKSEEDKANGTNGNRQEESDHEAEGSPISGIRDLLLYGQLILTNATHHRPSTENKIHAERVVRHSNLGWREKVKNVEKPAFEAAIEKKLEEWTYGTLELRTVVQVAQLDNLILILNQHLKESDIPSLEDDSDDSLSDQESTNQGFDRKRKMNGLEQEKTILMRPNYDKYTVMARTQRLIQAAAEKVPGYSSKVYAAVLRIVDKGDLHCSAFQQNPQKLMLDDIDLQMKVPTEVIVHACQEDRRREGNLAATTHNYSSNPHATQSPERTKGKSKRTAVQQNSDDDDNEEEYQSTKRTKTQTNGMVSTKSPKKKSKEKAKISIAYERAEEDLSVSDASMSDEEEESAATQNAIVRHLKILHEHGFLHYHQSSCENDGKSKWSVPFIDLSHRLRQREMWTTIANTHGSNGLRVVRILHTSGTLDDDKLLDASLLDRKVLRATLSKLKAAGYLEVQEVPRDNNRAPSKTIWLHSWNEDRCAATMLEEHYQAMSRCLQRLKAEKAAVREIIEKSQRTDVLGKEEELLAKHEIERLNECRRREDMLLTTLQKLDDGVLVLRDL